MNNSKNHLTKTICPSCKKEVPATSFCLFCGQKLAIESLEKGENIISTIDCPHCNQNVPKTDYCIKCGKQIKDLSQTYDKQAKVSVKSKESVVCPLCRQSVVESHNFCHLCGAKLKKEKESHEESLICNRCWKANPPEHTGNFCIYCGAIALGKRSYKSKLLEEPFKGYQLELSQELFQPTTVSISTLRQSLSSKNFPIKSVISHSSYFGVKTQEPKTNVVSRNFGVFDKDNLLNYFGVFILTLIIYALWFYWRYIEYSEAVNPFVIGILILGMSGLLTLLLMFPIWLSSLLVYKNSGYKLNFRLDLMKASITVIFNLIWLLFQTPFLFLLFGPIILHMGEIRDVKPQVLNQRSFRKGIILGVIFVISCSIILGLLTLTIVGMPGLFSGFLFQNHPLTGHILASYFGATWLSLILLLPLGDYYDKVIKQWNIIGYIILLTASFILLTHSLNLIRILTQEIIFL